MTTPRIEIIAGQAFIALTDNDGRKRTLPPLAAISEARETIKALQTKRAEIEAEASSIVVAMRTSLAEGTDTDAHRTRMAELQRLDAGLKDGIESVNEQISTIRIATTRADAENIANAARASITAALSPLDLSGITK